MKRERLSVSVSLKCNWPLKMGRVSQRVSEG